MCFRFSQQWQNWHRSVVHGEYENWTNNVKLQSQTSVQSPAVINAAGEEQLLQTNVCKDLTRCLSYHL